MEAIGAFRQRLGLLEGRQYVLVVGGRWGYKNAVQLYRTLAQQRRQERQHRAATGATSNSGMTGPGWPPSIPPPAPDMCRLV